MNDWLWYVTRSTGIVAAALSVATLTSGLRFSARHTGTRRRPNWWLAIHNRLGGLTLLFVTAHLAAAFADTNTGLRFASMFVPGADDGWPITWGVIGFWLLTIVVISSMARVRRRLPRRWWHVVHLASIPAVAVGVVHAYQAGSDMRAGAFAVVLASLVGVGMYPAIVRAFGLTGTGSGRRAPSTTPRR